MLATLLESSSRRRRPFGGAVASVSAHTLLIAGALYATAQAHVDPAPAPQTVRPVYFPAPQASARVSRSAAPRAVRPDLRREIFVQPRIDVTPPTIDLSERISRPTDFSVSTVGRSAARGGDGPSAASGEPFAAEQVEKQVSLIAGSPSPVYPEVLRSSGIEGQVVALFVVNETGRAEEETLRFVRSDNPLFEDAVRHAIRRMRFMPAEIAGRKVRQLVQMPFVFTLARQF